VADTTKLGSGVNQFFSLRYPSVHIVSLVAELVAYPCGVFLANILPVYYVNLGLLGVWCINPDHHFNIKEHAIITIMSNVSFGYGSADSTAIIQSYGKFYGFHLYPGFSILVVLCCQLLGFGVAGLASPWLVEPAGIIWPGVLSNCALLSSLHSRANAVANGWKISRLRFFMYAMAGAFVWYFFPGLIFVGLSYFTWVCWIVPNNLVANHLFGMVTGLGLSPITFDWSQVAYNTNPLLSPSWAGTRISSYSFRADPSKHLTSLRGLLSSFGSLYLAYTYVVQPSTSQSSNVITRHFSELIISEIYFIALIHYQTRNANPRLFCSIPTSGLPPTFRL